MLYVIAFIHEWDHRPIQYLATSGNPWGARWHLTEDVLEAARTKDLAIAEETIREVVCDYSEAYTLKPMRLVAHAEEVQNRTETGRK